MAAGRNIKGITVEIGGDTTGLTKALSGVNKEIKNTESQLKDVNKLLKLDPGNTELLAQKQRLLGDAISETKDKLEVLKKASEDAKDALAKGDIGQNQFDALQREIIEAENDLKDFEEQAKQSKTAVLDLAKAGESLSKIGDNITKVGEGLTKSVTVPLAAIGTASIAAFNEVDEGLDTVVQKTGATGAALEEMSDIVKNIPTEIPVDFSQAGEAVGEVNTRFGLVGDELEELSIKFLKFAELNNTDVSSSVDNVSSMLNAFGLSSRSAGDMLDTLNAVGQATGLSVDDLAQKLSQNAVQFKEMGLNAAESAQFMGMIEMAGLDTSSAMMGLKTAMKNATKDGLTLEQAMQGFTDTMNGNATETQKLQAAYDLFGSKAGGAIYNAFSTGKLSLDDFSSSLSTFSGNIDTTFENTLSPIDSTTTAMNALKVAGAEIGNSLMTVVQPALLQITEAVKKFAEWWNNLSPGMQNFIIKAALIAAAAGPVLTVVGKLTSGIGGLLTKLSGAGSAFGGLGKAASAAAAPAANAAKGVSSLSQSATGLLAVGAGIALAAAGFALLAQSAIALAEAGWPAIAVMGGMVAAIAGLAVGAAAIAPALTAGAAGLVAFGAAITLIGVGIFAATSGVALLATQLPTIAEYGSAAASALGELGIALATFGAGALVAGAGLTAVAGGLTLVAIGAVAAALGVATLGAGVAVLAVGVAALAVGMLALGAALTVCGSGLTIIAATASTAAVGMAALAISATAAFIPIAAGALSIAALDLALVSLLIPLGAITLEFGASAAACGLLALALDACATSVKDIAATASEAGQSLNEMVTAVDVVQTGLDGLKTIATNAVESFIEVFTAATPNATAVALALATGITTAVQTGLSPIAPNATLTMTTLNEIVMAGMTLMGTNILTFITAQMELLTNTSSAVVLTVSDGMGSCVSIISSACTSIAGYLSSLAENAYQWGADMMQGMINGIYSKMAELRAAAAEAASVVSANLHFSRPDEGPLRDYEEWMPDMMRGLADGIEKSRSMVQSAIKNVAGDMVISPKMGALELATATAKASSGTMNHSGTIRVEGVSDSGTLSGVVDIIIDQLRREVRM